MRSSNLNSQENSWQQRIEIPLLPVFTEKQCLAQTDSTSESPLESSTSEDLIGWIFSMKSADR
jgi:hypothetical protein